MDNEDDITAPGWKAIDAALDRVYAGREPLHWGTIQRWQFGGPDPLDGISAYKNLEPVPHWHIIGYGLTELYDKEGADPEVSGHGYELTFRLACDPSDEAPPFWALNFLQNVARAVAGDGSVFAVHHTVNANGPIARGDPTAIGAFAFVLDPVLGRIDTPNGRVEFLQIVGLTGDELEAKQSWDVEKLLALLAEGNPLLVTDLRRKSLLEDPAKAAQIRAGIERDGSSAAGIYVSELRWRRPLSGGRVELTVGAFIVPAILSRLRSRVLRGRPFELVNNPHGVRAEFLPGAEAGWETEGSSLVVRLTPAAAEEMIRTLRPVRGMYPLGSVAGLTVKVEPSEMRDGRGEITEIIG